jgi:death-on-curing protein
MAAAYLFHLASTQGFMDGNKRTGVVCASAFLRMNGYRMEASDDEVFALGMAVATNAMDKNEIAEWMRERSRPIGDDESG